MQTVLGNAQTFQLIVEKIADGIIVLDENQNIQYLNRAAESILNRNRNEIIGTPFAFEPMANEKAELDIVRKDGKPTIAEIRKTRVELGRQPLDIISLRDITQRKKTEEELFTAKKFKAISLIFGGISHDFNNLLSIIIGNIELGLEGIKPGAPLHENLSEALQAGLDAKQLTRRFLRLANISDPAFRPTRVDRLLKNLALDLSNETHAHFDLKLPDTLQAVAADPFQLSDVFNTILHNACEAVAPDNGVISITAENVRIDKVDKTKNRPHKKGAFVKLKVCDNGEGIDPANIPFIFDPYFTTKERSVEKGMGLGLSTAYNTIKNHGGYLFIESEKNKGTRVSIYLPAIQDAA